MNSPRGSPASVRLSASTARGPSSAGRAWTSSRSLAVRWAPSARAAEAQVELGEQRVLRRLELAAGDRRSFLTASRWKP